MAVLLPGKGTHRAYPCVFERSPTLFFLRDIILFRKNSWQYWGYVENIPAIQEKILGKKRNLRDTTAYRADII
jgi:hypothetical protein